MNYHNRRMPQSRCQTHANQSIQKQNMQPSPVITHTTPTSHKPSQYRRGHLPLNLSTTDHLTGTGTGILAGTPEVSRKLLSGSYSICFILALPSSLPLELRLRSSLLPLLPLSTSLLFSIAATAGGEEDFAGSSGFFPAEPGGGPKYLPS